MEKFNISCPVCGKTIGSSICSNCGFLLILFPKEVPQMVHKFEHTRIRIMKQCYQSNNISKRNVITKSQNIHFQQSNSKQIVGSLIIRNLITESNTILPIWNGKNIYGGTNSNLDNFVYVNSIELGIYIPDIIFSIEYSNGGLLLIPNNNFTLSHNRCKIDRIMKLENDVYFFYSNLLSFNAVLLRKL